MGNEKKDRRPSHGEIKEMEERKSREREKDRKGERESMEERCERNKGGVAGAAATLVKMDLFR